MAPSPSINYKLTAVPGCKMSTIPEMKKKKLARDKAAAASATTAAIAAKAKAAEDVKSFTAKGKAYETEYAKLVTTAVDSRRAAKANNQIFVAPEEKLVFVIRIRGIIGVSPKVKKILQLFRLRQINNGVFIRINGATENMLRLIEPYVAYGYPTLKAVKDLIYKRGTVVSHFPSSGIYHLIC